MSRATRAAPLSSSTLDRTSRQALEDRLRAAESEVARLRAELQERTSHRDRLANIGQLVAGVAHDFNNVLTVIAVSCQLLELQPGLDQTGREHVGYIRRAADRGASMVWQILDFAHRGPIDRTPVDLDAFFTDLLPVLRLAQASQAQIALRSDAAQHWVSADAGRLDQIVTNLVTNATDAMPESGQITIALSREAGEGADRVRIDVSDTGKGIPADILPRIFEPFFSTKPPGHGTGLGLAQVQGLVTQHDGRIEASSVVGVGTTVTVWLPAVPPPGVAL